MSSLEYEKKQLLSDEPYLRHYYSTYLGLSGNELNNAVKTSIDDNVLITGSDISANIYKHFDDKETRRQQQLNENIYRKLLPLTGHQPPPTVSREEWLKTQEGTAFKLKEEKWIKNIREKREKREKRKKPPPPPPLNFGFSNCQETTPTKFSDIVYDNSGCTIM